MPGRGERSAARVVDLGGVEVEVEPVGLVDELGVAKLPSAALFAERRELAVEIGNRARVLGAELVPTRAVAGRITGEDGRDVGVLHLERVARDDARPGPPGVVDRREAHDVVLHDHVGLDLVEDLAQPIVDVARAVAQRPPGRLDELRELLDRRLAEDRRGVADEVLPELARLLLDLRRRPEAHQPLLESLRLERAGERLLDHEDDAMPALDEHLADSDAVVRRAIGALGEEDDRTHGRQPSHARLLRVKARSSVASVFFDELADR